MLSPLSKLNSLLTKNQLVFPALGTSIVIVALPSTRASFATSTASLSQIEPPPTLSIEAQISAVSPSLESSSSDTILPILTTSEATADELRECLLFCYFNANAKLILSFSSYICINLNYSRITPRFRSVHCRNFKSIPETDFSFRQNYSCQCSQDRIKTISKTSKEVYLIISCC